MSASTDRPYHHGRLRPALLEATGAEIDAVGPTALSLRKVAARAGVTHPAVAHHFGDKAGLLTAFAAEGYGMLADALEAAAPEGFLAQGLAYLRFATDHPAHFQVMFRPELLRADDTDLLAARSRSGAALASGAAAHGGAGDAELVGRAGWFLVHGAAELYLAGNLAPMTPEELLEQFTAVGRLTLGHLTDPAPGPT